MECDCQERSHLHHKLTALGQLYTSVPRHHRLHVFYAITGTDEMTYLVYPGFSNKLHYHTFGRVSRRAVAGICIGEAQRPHPWSRAPYININGGRLT